MFLITGPLLQSCSWSTCIYTYFMYVAPVFFVIKEIGPPVLLHRHTDTPSEMTVISSMWCLNPRVVSCRWRDVCFSGPWWLLHCVWLCNLAKAVQTRLWNMIGASSPGERGLGTSSGLKGETWSNPHPHTEEMCHIAHTFVGQWVSVLSF